MSIMNLHFLRYMNKMMKMFMTIFVLMLFSQPWTKADDIRDFEIEGMSIGDSLLDYFNENEIEDMKYPIVRGGNKFYEYHKVDSNYKSKNYDKIYLYFKTDDPNKIIQAISGRKYYINNIEACYNLQKNIVNELEKIFSEAYKDDKGIIKNSAFPNGDSYKNDISFYFENDAMVHTACYDFSIKDTNTRDRLSIAIFTKQYLEWFWSL